MRLTKAEEVKSRLTAPQQRRYRLFCKNLSTDKDPKLFDDDMDRILSEIVRDKQWYEQEKKYLASLGFNQSRYIYSKIDEQIHNFAETHVPYRGWLTHFKNAKSELIDDVSSWKLVALDYFGNDDIQEWIPRNDAHAGWNFIETGKRTKGEYRENLLQNYSEKVELAKEEGSFNYMILPGTRTQTSPPYDSTNGSKKFVYIPKPRLVSMFALYQVLGESVFAGPVQRRMSTVEWYAGGKNDRGIYFVINRFMRRHKKMWLSVDYSKYDQSIPGWLIYEAFDVIEAMFDKSKGFDEELWRIVKDDFVHKVFVDGYGELVEAHDGVPSGSMFTQIIDTIVNILMIKTYFTARGKSSSEYSMIIMGDDNLMYASFDIDAEDLGGYIYRNFGVTVNATKSAQGPASEPPEFLSRIWTPRGVFRQPEILLAKLLYPENYRRYDKTSEHKIRQAVYMILSCFINDFPLGMKWIDKENIRVYSINEMSKAEHIKFTTGLMRYRLQTLGSKQYAA